jgi:hypothetical protein
VFFPYREKKVSHLYKNTGKIVLLFIFIFTLLYSRRDVQTLNPMRTVRLCLRKFPGAKAKAKAPPVNMQTLPLAILLDIHIRDVQRTGASLICRL